MPQTGQTLLENGGCDIRDIVALGHFKQGEFGENPGRATPSEATHVSQKWPRGVERVTTRFRAKAVMNPRAPCLANASDDIV